MLGEKLKDDNKLLENIVKQYRPNENAESLENKEKNTAISELENDAMFYGVASKYLYMLAAVGFVGTGIAFDGCFINDRPTIFESVGICGLSFLTILSAGIGAYTNYTQSKIVNKIMKIKKLSMDKY
jgi:hypothetical protein